MKLSRLEESLYSCCRLFVQGDEKSWVASGFFVKVKTLDALQSDLLVTCKHVVDGATSLSIDVRRRIGNDPIRQPTISRVDIELDKAVILSHPSEDLCAIFVHPLLTPLMKIDGAWPVIYAFGREHICDYNTLDACEEFVMIGCPSEMFDEINNLPIIRRGVTASHPGFHYKGSQQFLVDCPSYSGSSGSPIIRYGNLFFDRERQSYDLAMHPRIALLGMLTSGFDDVSEGGQHIDLGVAVSADAIAQLMTTAEQFLGQIRPPAAGWE